jgi:endonuclease NucS-like protein
MASPGFKIGDAYMFAAAHGLQSDASQIRSMRVHPSIPKPHVVRKGALVELFEKRGLIDQFITAHWPLRGSDAGGRRYSSYLDQKTLNEQLLSGQAPDEDSLDTAFEQETAVTNDESSFALEAQLRDFIVANLGRIPPISGSRLSLFTDASGRRGVEYPTDVGFIDILTVDETGNFFVFELKLERGPDRALGQLARYMGWVKMNLARETGVGGVIVAKSIDEKLRYAVCVMANVTLLEYEIEFRLRDVGSMAGV